MDEIIMDKYSFKLIKGDWYKFRRGEMLKRANNVELELIEYIRELDRRVAW